MATKRGVTIVVMFLGASAVAVLALWIGAVMMAAHLPPNHSYTRGRTIVLVDSGLLLVLVPCWILLAVSVIGRRRARHRAQAPAESGH